jgi:hypothetical protein
MSERVIIHAAKDTHHLWRQEPCKHLTMVEGETLLGRVVRQFGESGCEVIVTGHYVEGVTTVVVPPPRDAEMHGDKYLATEQWWSTTDRTIHVYGDTWYSDEAVTAILADDRKTWLLFGRRGGSELTGKPSPECFAHSFWPKEHELEKLAIHSFEAGHFADLPIANAGLDVFWQRFFGDVRFVTIDDWTEDFDTPAQLATWLLRRPHTG